MTFSAIKSHSKKLVKPVIYLIAVLLIISIYWLYDPGTTEYFPKCPFFSFTGLLCPGCGSQRALYHLLNFNIAEAFNENMLMVLSIPYIATGIIFDLIISENKKFLQFRKVLFGKKAIYIILCLIIIFWIARNINP